MNTFKIQGIVKKDTHKSEFLIEINGFYLYKSVTGLNLKEDIIDYTIGHNNGNEFGRFSNLESAIRQFNSVYAHYNQK